MNEKIEIDNVLNIIINARIAKDWNLMNEGIVLLMSMSTKYSHLDINRLTSLVKGL